MSQLVQRPSVDRIPSFVIVKQHMHLVIPCAGHTDVLANASTEFDVLVTKKKVDTQIYDKLP